MAVTALTTAFVALRNALSFGDDIADTAKKLAITTDALQEYRFAVHALGGDYKDADKALEAFAKTFGAAHAGLNKKATKPFEALGLDAKTFTSTEDALQAVIKKIANLKSTAEQAAIADKLGLSAMLPALRDGAGAIEELRKKAHDLGYVMDADVIEKAGEANDKFEDLSAVLDVQLKTALVGLAPLLLDVAGGLNDAARFAVSLANGLNNLNQWAPSQALMNIFAGARGAGAGVGKFLGTDRLGAAIGLGGRSRSQLTSAQMKAFAAGKPTPLTGSLIAPSGGGGGRKRSGPNVAEGSERAIETATREELSARMALTEDIRQLADLKSQQVDRELASDNRQLQQDVAEGKITSAAAAIATALNGRAAEERKALIARETENKLVDQELDQREEIAGYYERISSINADLASTAAERNAIELKALADDQRLEKLKTETRLAQQVASGEILASTQAAALAALADMQAAELALAQREATIRLQDEASARTEAAIQLQIDLLESQRGLADTAASRREIDLEILKLEQELERIKLKEVVASAASTKIEKDIAAARLRNLAEVQGNDRRAAYDLREAFEDTAGSLNDLRSAFESQDWYAAVNSLKSAFDGLKMAFGPNGTLANKIGAAAGVANLAGQAVGGVAGAGLSGAASGAMAGFSLGGPVGAAIGAVVGGIAGLFSGSKAKKAEKAQAAAQAAEEARRAAEAEAARLLEIANQKRELEIQLLEASGKTQEALEARRSDQLASLDESLRGLQQSLWDVQDAAKAAADAAEALAEAQKLAADRISDAEGALADAYQRESGEIADRVDQFRQLGESLRNFRQGLDIGNLSSLSPTAQAAAAKASFKRVAGPAGAGDPEAMKALQGVSEAYLEAAKRVAPDAKTYARALLDVRTAV
ncbi:MAG: hypothetical protein Q8R82_12710, partial [Hyphomonadaceae bacterium]|nr:hypothetical protein [Hyphomonadaceae bacterium]